MNRTMLTILALVSLLAVACGGQESYTTPLVLQSHIAQSECTEISTAAVPPETVTVSVRSGSVVMQHENIYLPKGSLLGIEDRDGLLSWRDAEAYYYLDAGEEFITLRESARLVNSDEFCLYSLSVSIGNISGGEYTFYLFDHTGAAIPEATAELEIR